MDNMQLYDDIADWYDILFPIPEGYDREFVEYFHLEVLQKNHAHSILDCACGTGNQSIGLAKLGYSVVSSDLNLEMLRKAQAKARYHKTELNSVNLGWDELSKVFGRERFDAVLCAGNSLYHYSSNLEKLKYLTEMCAVLRKDGVCFVDYERWDDDFREIGRQRFRLYGSIEDKGRNIVRFSVYEHEGRKQILTLYFIIEKDKRVEIKTSVVLGYAFTADELFTLAKEAGFSKVQSVRRPGIWNLNAMLAIK